MVSDDLMRMMLGQSRAYTLVLLKAGPKRASDGVESIVWEHARRNFELRAQGVLSIVCPVTDGSEWAGIGIFNGSVDEVKQIMDGDPGVAAGVFVYEVHPCRSFPGDRLPQ
jgi:hypothetical protein